MGLQQYSVQFQGYRPSEFVQEYLDEHLKELQLEACGATLKATFKRESRTLKGIVSLYSSAGHFLAIAKGNKTADVCRKLMVQIRRQIEKKKSSWKEKGFRQQETYSAVEE